MNWQQDQTNEAEEPVEGSDQAEGATEPSPDPLEVLTELERFHENHHDEFFRMAAIRELSPEVREALDILLALPPDAVRILAGLKAIGVEEQRLIRRTLGLSDDVRSALRGLLPE